MQYVWYVRTISPPHVQLTRLAWYSQFLLPGNQRRKQVLKHSRGLGGNSLTEHDNYDPKGSKITCDHLTKPTGWHLVHYHSSILECYTSTTFHQSLSTFHVIYVGLQRAGTYVAYHVYSPLLNWLLLSCLCQKERIFLDFKGFCSGKVEPSSTQTSRNTNIHCSPCPSQTSRPACTADKHLVAPPTAVRIGESLPCIHNYCAVEL